MDKRERTERNKEKRREGKRKERKIGRERENRVDGRRRRYRGENSDARNESSAVENPDRNQSDSICIMEKARDNVCSGLSARARFLFRLSSSLSLSPFLPSSHLAISLSLVLSLYFARFHSRLSSLSPQVRREPAADWFEDRVEPKSLLMGSFGFDHRLTFPIHRAIYVSLPRVRALYLAFADLLALSPASFQSLLYRVVTNRSFHPPAYVAMNGIRRETGRESHRPGGRSGGGPLYAVVKNVDWEINSTYLTESRQEARSMIEKRS